MKLTFGKVRRRGRHWENVIDKGTGNKVRDVTSRAKPYGGGGIEILLLDGMVDDYEAVVAS